MVVLVEEWVAGLLEGRRAAVAPQGGRGDAFGLAHQVAAVVLARSTSGRWRRSVS